MIWLLMNPDLTPSRMRDNGFDEVTCSSRVSRQLFTSNYQSSSDYNILISTIVYVIFKIA